MEHDAPATSQPHTFASPSTSSHLPYYLPHPFSTSLLFILYDSTKRDFTSLRKAFLAYIQLPMDQYVLLKIKFIVPIVIFATAFNTLYYIHTYIYIYLFICRYISPHEAVSILKRRIVNYWSYCPLSRWYLAHSWLSICEQHKHISELQRSFKALKSNRC